MSRRSSRLEPRRSALRRDLAREARLGVAAFLVLVLACLAPAPSRGPAPADSAARREPFRIQRRWRPAGDLSAIIDHPLLLAERAAGPAAR